MSAIQSYKIEKMMPDILQVVDQLNSYLKTQPHNSPVTLLRNKYICAAKDIERTGHTLQKISDGTKWLKQEKYYLEDDDLFQTIKTLEKRAEKLGL